MPQQGPCATDQLLGYDVQLREPVCATIDEPFFDQQSTANGSSFGQQSPSREPFVDQQSSSNATFNQQFPINEPVFNQQSLMDGPFFDQQSSVNQFSTIKPPLRARRRLVEGRRPHWYHPTVTARRRNALLADILLARHRFPLPGVVSARDPYHSRLSAGPVGYSGPLSDRHRRQSLLAGVALAVQRPRRQSPLRTGVVRAPLLVRCGSAARVSATFACRRM